MTLTTIPILYELINPTTRANQGYDWLTAAEAAERNRQLEATGRALKWVKVVDPDMEQTDDHQD